MTLAKKANFCLYLIVFSPLELRNEKETREDDGNIGKPTYLSVSLRLLQKKPCSHFRSKTSFPNPSQSIYLYAIHASKLVN